MATLIVAQEFRACNPENTGERLSHKGTGVLILFCQGLENLEVYQRMADEATPLSNRGVENTEQSSLRACVDWVQVTFISVHDVPKILDVLGMKNSQFIEQDKGLYGYQRQLKCGNIRILFQGNQPGMGVHVQMSGQGCREYETYHNGGWDKFFQKCLGNGGEFSRLDIAIDDIATEGQRPYFTVNKILRKIREGCCVSKFRKGRYMVGLDLNSGESLGETIYFGKGCSDLQVRMYEKDYERTEAGKKLEENIVAWNRIEVQGRRDRAQALALYLVNHNDILPVVQGVLRHYISFVVRDSEDSNKARRDACKWWIDFLDNAEKLRLAADAPDKTIEKAKTWLKKQVEPTMGMLFLAMGSDIEQFVEMINNGLERMTHDQRRMAEEYFDQLIAERAEWDYLRKNKWSEMMFRTTREGPTDFEKRFTGDEDE